MNKTNFSSQSKKVFPRGLLLILGLYFCLLFLADAVSAQSDGSLKITGLQSSEFPVIRFFMEVMDGDDNYVTDLRPEQIDIIEDGYARPVTELNRTEPGIQLILAVNESPSLTNQYQGVSSYRIFMQKLEDWAQSIDTNQPGNYSYVTNNGVQIAQADNVRLFSQTFSAYEPDLVAARPGLTSLTMALDLTTDPLPDPYMKRAILYVTPLLDAAARDTLPNIAERAAQLGTRVFIWVIAPGYSSDSDEVAPLRQLADISGGDLFLFSGDEEFPDPEEYFEPLRFIYDVAYESGLTESGQHRVVVSVTRPDMEITGEEVLFSIQVSPPNPIFLEPPSRIVRSFSEETSGVSLQPDSFPVQILLEFPDGHPREIRFTRLYVNDEVAAENLSEPFDQFSVPLDSYPEGGQLRLKVEVEDELGLNQMSIETLVEITVEKPQQTWIESALSGRGLTILISLSVAALILAMVIFYNNQRSIWVFARRRFRRFNDPVTQPVVNKNRKKKKNAAAINSPTIKKQPVPVNAPAKLIRLSEDGNPIPERVIPLIRRETTLGADPQQSICVIDSPSVSPLHTRISQSETGQFLISDAGSISGTWLNHDPVNEKSAKLEHSDIIHIGLMAFRFEVSQPTSVRKVKVTPYQTERL